jgi:hypothetical protein
MNVDPEGQLPFIVADVFDLLETGLVRGVVDQNVDGAELLDGPVDDRAAMLGILDIAGDEDTGAACFFHQPPGLARVLVFIEVGDEHVGAFARKSESDGAADATVTTGDDGLSASQSPGAFVGPLAVVRNRLHLGGQAGHRLPLLGKRRLGVMEHFLSVSVGSLGPQRELSELDHTRQLRGQPRENPARRRGLALLRAYRRGVGSWVLGAPPCSGTSRGV